VWPFDSKFFSGAGFGQVVLCLGAAGLSSTNPQLPSRSISIEGKTDHCWVVERKLLCPKRSFSAMSSDVDPKVRQQSKNISIDTRHGAAGRQMSNSVDDMISVDGGLGGSAIAKAMAEDGARVLLLEQRKQFATASTAQLAVVRRLLLLVSLHSRSAAIWQAHCEFRHTTAEFVHSSLPSILSPQPDTSRNLRVYREECGTCKRSGHWLVRSRI
jgi:hypothetical protein